MVVPVVHSVVLSSVVHSVVHTVCNPMVLSSVVLHPVVLSEVGATVVVPVAPSAAAQRYKCGFANVPYLLESLTGLIQPFSVHCLPTAVYPLPAGGGRNTNTTKMASDENENEDGDDGRRRACMTMRRR